MAGAHPAPRHRSVVVEADGGSRGNPGPAAYGAVLLDAETGETIAERAECIGRATNNVAEYRGLIAGLELHAEHAPEADLAVRMDSKLVVEQMSGRWKVKHPDMRPLATQAAGLAPAGTTYTWIPRELNKHADRLVNEALDAQASRSARPAAGVSTGSTAREGAGVSTGSTTRGWSRGGVATTVMLVRHGVTAHTVDKRFSGGLSGSDPGLTEDGRSQVRATADWLSPMAEGVDLVVSSPVLRTRESAKILGARLGREVVVEDALAEMEFGSWDGLTFAEVAERFPDDLDRWLGSLDHAPGGRGESFREVERRVLAGLERLLVEQRGRTVLAVSHVTPIKVLVAHTLQAPLEAVYRMELAPASVTVLSFYEEGSGGASESPTRHASLRMFNARPTGDAFTGR